MRCYLSAFLFLFFVGSEQAAQQKKVAEEAKKKAPEIKPKAE
jgi:hypothetical protein